MWNTCKESHASTKKRKSPSITASTNPRSWPMDLPIVYVSNGVKSFWYWCWFSSCNDRGWNRVLQKSDQTWTSVFGSTKRSYKQYRDLHLHGTNWFLSKDTRYVGICFDSQGFSIPIHRKSNISLKSLQNLPHILCILFEWRSIHINPAFLRERSKAPFQIKEKQTGIRFPSRDLNIQNQITVFKYAYINMIKRAVFPIVTIRQLSRRVNVARLEVTNLRVPKMTTHVVRVMAKLQE